MIASLGMYDRAETALATNRYWAAIRNGLRARDLPAPETLTRGPAALWPVWTASDLVFSQTCGMPYRVRLHESVALVGTPDHGVEGCAPGYYVSVFVARSTDPRQTPSAFSGARFAFNEALSQSGWAAPAAWFAAHGLDLAPSLETGSHGASADAVLRGKADFAALDAVTWALMCEHDEWAAGLQVIGQTNPTPSLPYITAKGGDTDAIFDAVAAAIAEISAEDRATLRLKGIVRILGETYLAVPTPAPPQIMAGAK